MQNNSKIYSTLILSDKEELIMHMQRRTARFLGVVTLGFIILLFVIIWLF